MTGLDLLEPRHLLAAVPTTTKKTNGHRPLGGEIPSPVDVPAACRFVTRCPRAIDRCRVEVPRLAEVEPGHLVACFNYAPVER